MTDHSVVHEGGRLSYFGFSNMDCGIVIKEHKDTIFNSIDKQPDTIDNCELPVNCMIANMFVWFKVYVNWK